MAYDEGLAQRVREILGGRGEIAEKKMFGGLAFMLSGNMCCGITGDQLMVRVGPDNYQDALGQPHAREMDFTGRAHKGYVYVAPVGVASDSDLKSWVEKATGFVGALPPG